MLSMVALCLLPSPPPMEVTAMDDSLMDFGKTIYGYLLLPSPEHYSHCQKNLCFIEYALKENRMSNFQE